MQNCKCQQPWKPTCKDCYRTWIDEEEESLLSRYMYLPEPLKKQIINRQINLLKEYLS